MKIFTIAGDYIKDKIGGAEYHMDLLENEFIKQGHEVFHVHAQAKSLSNYEKIEKVDGKIVYHIQTNNPIYQRFYMPFFINFLKEVVSKEADIIYIREFHNHFILSKFCKEYKIPLVRELAHDDHALHFYNSFYMNIDYKSAIPRIFSDFVMDKYTNFLTQSKEQTDLLRENFGVESKTIYKGHPFPIEFSNRKKGGKIVTFLANMRDFKRPELFIELAKMNSDKDYKFVMAGPIPSDRQNKILSIIKDCPNIFYFGTLSYDESNTLLSKSSVLINTSTAEGFSNTFIQAWLRGTPVLSLNVDPDNIIQDKKLGMSFEGDLVRLNFYLNDLMTNSKRLQDLSEKILKYSISNFDIANVSKKYITFFEKIKYEKM